MKAKAVKVDKVRKPKTVRVGIMPQDKIRERMLAIARGEIKPGPRDPKVWFTSLKSAAQVLSDENRALIRTIANQSPQSVSELARLTGRKPPNVTRTLHTLVRYGIVELRSEKNRKRPVAKATRFEIAAD